MQDTKKYNKLYSICVFKMSLEVFVPGTCYDFDDGFKTMEYVTLARSNPWFATQIIVKLRAATGASQLKSLVPR